MKKVFNLPVSLCFFIIENNLFRAAEVYTILQMNCSGIIKLEDAMLTLQNFKCLSSKASRMKYLHQLLSLNWIGIDKIKNVIYLRSIKAICEKLVLSMNRVVACTIQHLKNFKLFIYCVVLANKISQQLTAIKLSTGRKSEAKNYHVSKQNSYAGLSKMALAKLFKCSPSKAIAIKQNLKGLKLVRVKKHSMKILEMGRADFAIKHYLGEMNVKLKNRLFFIKNLKTGKIEVHAQLHDEIFVDLVIKKRGGSYQGIRAF